MTENSLLSYVRDELGELTREPHIDKKGVALENAVVQSYEGLRDNLKGVSKRLKGVFDIYVNSGDLSEGHLDRFIEGVKVLEDAPYKTQKSSVLKEFLHSTSSWYASAPDINGVSLSLDNPEGFKDRMFVRFATRATSLTAGGTLSILALALSNPILGFAAMGGVAAPYLVSYALFLRETEAKPTSHKFKSTQAKDYVLELSRLHQLTQEIEKEVDDIDTLSGRKRYDFVREYGLQRMKREGIKLKRLPDGERENRIMQYGAQEVEERINKAKREVRGIKDSIEAILRSTGTEILSIGDDYVTYGEKVYNGEKEVDELVESELGENKLEELRKRLPRKQGTAS